MDTRHRAGGGAPHLLISFIVFGAASAIGCDNFAEAFKEGFEEGYREASEGSSGEPAVAAPPSRESAPVVPEEAEVAEKPLMQQVTLFDQGLQVPRSTFEMPHDWRVHQNISTNPQTGGYHHYVFDRFGPAGELIRATPMAPYFAPLGKTFEKSWRATARKSLADAVQDLKIGKLEPSSTLAEAPQIAQMARMMPLETLEAPLSGTMGSQKVAGKAYVVRIPNGPEMGSYVVELLVSPPERLEQTIETYAAMAKSSVTHPEYDRASAAMGQRLSKKSQADHQARMRANQARFDAHQARMRDTSAANDRANQAWLNNFRGGGAQTGGNGYESHEQFIDTMRESETFHDPSTGQNRSLDGSYRYNYTDGAGNFHRTNDANFDPSSLQGDWQQVDPLSP